MPDQPTNEQYSPLALLGIVLASLLLFAVFFLGFLVAPLAILLLFYVGFSAVDRSRKGSKRNETAPVPNEYDEGEQPVHVRSAEERLARESTLRRAERDRQTADASLPAHRPARPDGE